MRKTPTKTAVIVCGFIFLLPQKSDAAEGAYSNYLPGTYGDFGMALMPTEKWTIRNDVYFYQLDTDIAVRNGLIQANINLDFKLNFTTVLYKPDIELFGGQYAFGTVISYANLNLNASVIIANQSHSLNDDTQGLGDVVLIPIMLFWQHDNFHFSIAEYIIAPTGDYDSSSVINNGLNYWSFDTDFSTTYLNPETGQDYSINIGHIYNTENSDTNYQTGQEFHLDTALNQFFSETFAVGLHGFYLNQFTDDDGAGALLGGFRGKAYGYGPAILWTPNIRGQDFSIIGKWLKETNAENRLEGDHYMLSVAFDW